MEEAYTQVVMPDGRVFVVLPLEAFESLSSRTAPMAFALKGGAERDLPASVRRDIASGLSPLAAWRHHYGYSQTSLSEVSGVSRRTIMRMEAVGLGAGTHGIRKKIAEALGVKIGDI